jgi:small-conductance mechanosensitive channel
MFDPIIEGFYRLFTPENFAIALRIVTVIVIGFLLIRILHFVVKRGLKKRFSPQSLMILRKVIFYTGAFVILILILKQLGVKLAALLGAAGIAGIAIGFASQTSLSNIISGFFLISEKTFAVDDVIIVDGIRAIVLSIDLLSVKVRTFDNQFIRIPNEKMIKTDVTTVTRFPIRRLDVNISVAYREDLQKVRELLLEIAHGNPYCLENPEPLFVIKEFGAHGIELLLGAWFVKTDYLVLKNSIMMEIKRRFDENDIEIPFPHLSLYTGTESKPLKVQVEGADS